MKITKEESLFRKYYSSGPASFFEECLAQFGNRVQKKLLWDCSFFVLCEGAPKIFKAIGESTFFLMALSTSEGGYKVGTIKFS